MMKRLPVHFSVQELVSICGGTLYGDPTFVVRGVSSIESPQLETITFARVRSRNALERHARELAGTAVLFPSKLAWDGIPTPAPRIAVPDPFGAMIAIVERFFAPVSYHPGIHPSAVIAPTARVAAGAHVGPLCTVGEGCEISEGAVLLANVTVYDDVFIGPRTILHGGVVVRERCTLGSDCIVHSNTTVGGDGFGYVPDQKVGLKKVPQVGRVVLGDRVEVGSNTSVDRGAFGDTVIGDGTKIDNLVQIGHNVVIGSNSLICGQAGIAGSTIIGDRVVLGGDVKIADHVKIASDVRVGGGGRAYGSVETPGDYAGTPLVPARAWRRAMAAAMKNARSTTGRELATKEGEEDV